MNTKGAIIEANVHKIYAKLIKRISSIWYVFFLLSFMRSKLIYFLRLSDSMQGF